MLPITTFAVFVRMMDNMVSTRERSMWKNEPTFTLSSLVAMNCLVSNGFCLMLRQVSIQPLDSSYTFPRFPNTVIRMTRAAMATRLALKERNIIPIEQFMIADANTITSTERVQIPNVPLNCSMRTANVLLSLAIGTIAA